MDATPDETRQPGRPHTTAAADAASAHLPVPDPSALSRQILAFAVDRTTLTGELVMPADCRGIVVFAHGSGSSRLSPRNIEVSRHLQGLRMGTLLFDLLDPGEARVDQTSACYRFDVPLLSQRLGEVLDQLVAMPSITPIPIALFGASTGAAAVLSVAAEQPQWVRAIVSRGGRPDLAGDALPRVRAPTLLIVGSRDNEVQAFNRAAMRRMRCPVSLLIVPGASHLFDEPGTLQTVCVSAGEFLLKHLEAGHDASVC
jgi:putative phosphoribosyl transferase